MKPPLPHEAHVRVRSHGDSQGPIAAVVKRVEVGVGEGQVIPLRWMAVSCSGFCRA